MNKYREKKIELLKAISSDLKCEEKSIKTKWPQAFIEEIEAAAKCEEVETGTLISRALINYMATRELEREGGLVVYVDKPEKMDPKQKDAVLKVYDKIIALNIDWRLGFNTGIEKIMKHIHKNVFK